MKAFELAMLFLFMNIGIFIVSDLGVFGPQLVGQDTISIILSKLDIGIDVGNQWVGFGIFGLVLSAIAFFSTWLGSKLQTQQGAGVVIFGTIFFLIWLESFPIFITIATLLPGATLFVAGFQIAGLLLFIFTVIQMSSGGQKVFA